MEPPFIIIHYYDGTFAQFSLLILFERNDKETILIITFNVFYKWFTRWCGIGSLIVYNLITSGAACLPASIPYLYKRPSIQLYLHKARITNVL